MFSKPMYGWTTVSFGNIELGQASYLTDVPVDVLDTFISYLTQDYFVHGFNTTFDAEGYMFSIVEFDGSLYLIDSKTDADEPNIKELKPESLGLNQYEKLTNIIIHLANEFINDLENNLQDWVDWEDFEETTDEERKIRKELILTKVEILKRLIRKHEKKNRLSSN